MGLNAFFSRLQYLLLILLAVLGSCLASKKNGGTLPTQKNPVVAFDKQGHRGCRGLMPENTIPAMIRALQLGVSTLEMDAQITSDSKVLISHDPYFNPDITTAPDGSYLTEKEGRDLVIYHMTYAATQRYDVGLKPYPRFPRQEKIAAHKPLLADLIDSVELFCQVQHRALPFYNIETKSLPATDHIFHPPPAEFVELLMAVINSKGIASRTIIQSFDQRTLQVVHARYPGMRTALLIDRTDQRSLDLQCDQLGFLPSIYSPEYHLVTDSLLKACHQKNIKVIPWTVDDAAVLDGLTRMGVDGIITDFPDLFH